MFEDALNMPNPMENPGAFQAAVQSGDIDLGVVENCHACIMEVGVFYLQRPYDESLGQVRIVKVVHVVENDDGTQFGGWVQE